MARRSISITADITTKEECEKIANKISERENGKLDILINNSGVACLHNLIKKNGSKY